jgi:hypothetical protein
MRTRGKDQARAHWGAVERRASGVGVVAGNRRPKGDEPDDENPEFDQFEEAMKRLLEGKLADDPAGSVAAVAQQDQDDEHDEDREWQFAVVRTAPRRELCVLATIVHPAGGGRASSAAVHHDRGRGEAEPREGFAGRRDATPRRD